MLDFFQTVSHTMAIEYSMTDVLVSKKKLAAIQFVGLLVSDPFSLSDCPTFRVKNRIVEIDIQKTTKKVLAA